MDLSQVSPGLWLAVLAANSLGGLLKENDRAGLPLFAVPALAAITLVEDAVVLMVFPSVGANLWLVMNHRRYHNLLREHLPFLVTGFIGGLSGTGLLVLVSDRGLKLLLVIWLGLYLIRYFSNRNSLKLFGADRKSGYPLGPGRRNDTGLDRHICTGRCTLLSHPRAGAGSLCFCGGVHVSFIFRVGDNRHGEFAIADHE